MAVVLSPIDADIAWSSLLQEILGRIEAEDISAVTDDEWASLRTHWHACVIQSGDAWCPASRTYARLLNRFGPMWLPTLKAS